ncbi:MAG TPA: hypothetical protein VF062_19595 [Candidatus Limnocylindrales bacterium]
MPKRQPRVGKQKKTLLDVWRANDAANGVSGKRKVVKGGVTKWVPIKKK